MASYIVHTISNEITQNKLSDIISNFDQLDPKDKIVETKDNYRHILEVPTSRSIGPFLIGSDNGVFKWEIFHNIFPEKYRDANFEWYINNKLEKLEFQLHCHNRTGFFIEYTDKRKSEQHFANLLLFPPASISPFEGGDLFLYPIGEQSVKIRPSKFKDWTIVAFTFNVRHECSPILSGRRFVFKTELEY